MPDAQQPAAGDLEVQIWSDVVCPWCWIGERHLELALEQTGLADRAQIVVRSYQLDPGATRRSLYEHLAEKVGGSIEQVKEMTGELAARAAAVGLEINFDRAISAPTGDAHQLLQLAREHGKGMVLMRRLHRAHFTDGADISDHGCLLHLAGDVGLDEHEAEAALQTGAYAGAVLADIEQASRLGVRGVPFFVLGRRYGVSGAQPVDAMAEALRRTADALTTAG